MPMHVNAQEPGTPSPFEFVERPPHPLLADLAASVWTARGSIGYGRERILPTPNPVLVVNLGSPFRIRAAHSAHGDDLRREGWLVGPQTGYVENEPLAETDVVGVILKPWGPGALFDLSALELRDRIVDLEAIWGPTLDRLRERLIASPDMRQRRAIMTGALVARRHGNPPGAVHHIADGLASGRIPSVGLASAHLRVSRKHLNHLFDRYVGLAPRDYARIHRFDRALKSLGATTSPSLAQVAHAHGYYDQSHMNRDFSSFAGITPTAYLRLRAAHMTEGVDDSGLFVPGI